MPDRLLKYETHCHTDEVSQCAHLPAHDVVRLYKDAGYAGIVITDHLSKWTFHELEDAAWDEKIDFYMKGYRAAKEAGEEYGVAVLFAMELAFAGTPEDYLCFGVTEAFLRAHPEILSYDLEHFYPIAKEAGIVVLQAHPFRRYLKDSDPKFLDGVEGINGNPRHDSRNYLALEFGRHNHMIMTSGSDCHEAEDVGRGGILTYREIHTMDDFLALLKSGSYQLIGTQA